MRLTLLEYVQTILSALNLDQVNSISDTPESLQVAAALKTSYLNLLGRLRFPEHVQLFQLNASTLATPTLMYVPQAVTRIDWIKYFDTNPADGNQLQSDQFGAYSPHDVNTDLQNNSGVGWSTTSLTSNTVQTGTVTFTVSSGAGINAGDVAIAYNGDNYMSGTVSSITNLTLVLNITATGGAGTFDVWTITNSSSLPTGPGYKTVKILPIGEFITLTSTFNPQQSDVGVFQLPITNNTTGLTQDFTFYYYNDITPRHCCIISDNYIVFDSYDNTQDAFLQTSKTMCKGWNYPTWTMSDTFVPSLSDENVPLLLNEAKSLAFQEIKNQPHAKAEVETKRQLMAFQKFKSTADRPTYFNELPNFGRAGAGYWTESQYPLY